VLKLHKQIGHFSDCLSLLSDTQAAEGTALDVDGIAPSSQT
jgi:hypothetical protein